jgi:hypothetical protein
VGESWGFWRGWWWLRRFWRSYELWNKTFWS